MAALKLIVMGRVRPIWNVLHGINAVAALKLRDVGKPDVDGIVLHGINAVAALKLMRNWI